MSYSATVGPIHCEKQMGRWVSFISLFNVQVPAPEIPRIVAPGAKPGISVRAVKRTVSSQLMSQSGPTPFIHAKSTAGNKAQLKITAGGSLLGDQGQDGPSQDTARGAWPVR
jgi:hypothetical protein